MALSTMTPSLMDSAYKWLIITWFGSGNKVGSHCWKKGKIITNTKMFTQKNLTESGVSLLRITCSKWGGRTGGPDTFSHGLAAGIVCEYSFCDVLPPTSLSLASAWNTSKSDLRTETKLFLVPMSLSIFFCRFFLSLWNN